MTTLARTPDMDNQRVLRIKNGPLDTNCYIYKLSERGACLLIDPGMDHVEILKILAKEDLQPKAIFLTHGHFDHIASVVFFQEKYEIPIYMHPADMPIAEKSNFVMMALKIKERIKIPRIDIEISDGYTATFGADQVKCIHLPGHTPGSCGIELGGAIFIGDTFYKNNMVFNSLPGENKQQLKASIERFVTIIPDYYWIYPGHGSADIWQHIKIQNQMLRDFIGLSGSDL